MHYFFFDIDGTLLLSGGAGRVAMTQVMTEMFGLSDLQRIEVHGRTDRGIIADLFRIHEVDVDEATRQRFSERYHRLLPQAMEECQGELMPGVVELLNHLHGLPDTRLGILTGNSESAAWTKLKHFDLDGFFDFGGYGESHIQRNDVARMTLDRCRQFYGDPAIDPGQAWVVGDTIHDIACARSIQAKVVAVATGGAELKTLQDHQPDVLLSDLSDARRFLLETGVVTADPKM